MMTRKEKEKILLDGLELRVGDRIEFLNDTNETFTIIENEEYYFLKNNSNRISDLPLISLIVSEFTIISYHQKTYGEYKCGEIKYCSKCPLNYLNCCIHYDNPITLFECLDLSIKDHNSKIYKAFHDELDKVVEDENEILN